MILALLNTISNNLLDKNIKIYLVDSDDQEQKDTYSILSQLIKDTTEPKIPEGLNFQCRFF